MEKSMEHVGNLPEVTSAFVWLASSPPSVVDETLSTIERIITLIFDRTSKLDKVW